MTIRLATIATGVLLVMALPAWSAQTSERLAKASLPAKPPTATAVIAPKVGPATGNAALNPQPIPPGLGATSVVKPLTTTGNGALNTQPIPPGHAAASTLKPLTTTGNGALNTQPIPPGH
jgi:hypothetical protein